MTTGPAARRARLRAALPADVDALLVTRDLNVRYLSGLPSSNAAMLLGRHDAVLATDGRYTAAAARLAPDLDCVPARAVAAALLHAAARRGLRRVGLEGHDVTLAVAAGLRSVAAEVGVELVEVTDEPVEAIRAVKEPEEVDLLREACRITVEALDGLLTSGGVRAGRTEAAVARDVEARMLALGAEAIAFPTIVAAGAAGAEPHHDPGDRVLAVGDLVTIDLGARVAGYHADMTRTVAVGRAAGWQRDLHAAVVAAQAAARAAVVPGARTKDVDRIARTTLLDAGYPADAFPHGLGHGVGLEVHESPGLGPAAVGRLEVGHVVTAEPGAYLVGRGGVRIEDTIAVVAPTGDAIGDVLTVYPRDLVVV